LRFVSFLQAIVDMLETRASPALQLLLSASRAHNKSASVATLSAVKNADKMIPKFRETLDSTKPAMFESSEVSLPSAGNAVDPVGRAKLLLELSQPFDEDGLQTTNVAVLNETAPRLLEDSRDTHRDVLGAQPSPLAPSDLPTLSLSARLDALFNFPPESSSTLRARLGAYIVAEIDSLQLADVAAILRRASESHPPVAVSTYFNLRFLTQIPTLLSCTSAASLVCHC
jgi:hypothetical protein